MAGVETPPTDAVAVNEPTMEFAVNTPDLAIPWTLVVTVSVPGANVPLGPLTGALKVTVMPSNRLPFASRTRADSGAAKAVLIWAFCGEPALASIDAASPGVTVTTEVAGENPGAEAVMVDEPTIWPITIGWTAGVLDPDAMETVAGLTVTLVGSLPDRLTVTPPGGAGIGKVTGSGVDTPAPTVRPAGRLIAPKFTTFTEAVVSARLGSALA